MGKAWPALEIHVPSCDPQLHELVLAELDDFQPTAIQEDEDASRLRAFFATADSRNGAARAVATAFGNHLFIRSIDVEDEDWAARSQAQLRAITVGRITVAPPWATEGLDPASTVLIRPSMGFGTGHHATTRLTLRALQDLPLEGRCVLDIGCGSGVLALAAAKLGAAPALGIDIDPDALANATENLELNGLAGRVRFEQHDFRETTGAADIVMANLTGALLERSAGRLAELVSPGGHLIVSGFMNTERPAVMPALERYLMPQAIAGEEEWLCAVLKSACRPATLAMQTHRSPQI